MRRAHHPTMATKGGILKRTSRIEHRAAMRVSLRCQNKAPAGVRCRFKTFIREVRSFKHTVYYIVLAHLLHPGEDFPYINKFRVLRIYESADKPEANDTLCSLRESLPQENQPPICLHASPEG